MSVNMIVTLFARTKGLYLFLFSLLFLGVQAQDEGFANYIKNKSIINEGGTELFSYKGVNYLVSVVGVAVGQKNEMDCRKVGDTKAKREMLSYINGSDITSFTELRISESAEDTIEGTKARCSQEFTEVIKERVLGTINQCSRLCGWYSEDKSVYYYALYKIIE